MSGRLRVVTLNLWGEQEPLDVRMSLIERQLRALDPDVVALQEVRQVLPRVPNQAETLARALGMHPVFCPATEWGGGLEGLALLSRNPVLHSGHVELPHAVPSERRILLWARIRHEAGVVLCGCTHLNYRLHHGSIREDQVEAVDAEMQRQEADLRVLMGDFNAVPDSDEIRYLRGLHSIRGRRTFYQDAWAQLHPGEAGYTWSRKNPFTQRLPFLEPDRRLDYVFVGPRSRDGRGHIHDCRIVLDVPDRQGVFPSDHFGLMADVQLAPLG
ncbi:MAG: endonuclease/exonuclease/phosphatase family protein [Myxococcales bacterium]|nr:endonuclease/exonuclease/phosphatase family protein [Myxococcota bacterium]MDW8283532.1 endonuclease/exonuclease/phosphatase family protein [Myxococcales bacterium]